MQLEYLVVKTRSGEAGYCVIGQGQPLVLLVGYSGTLYHWNKYLVTDLAQHFTVYLLDNRGVGLSQSKNAKSMEGLAQDVFDFIDVLAIHNPIILGWSMGGVIAQSMLKQNMVVGIHGLVLLSTMPQTSYVEPKFIELLINAPQMDKEEFKYQSYSMFFSKAPSKQLKEIIINHNVVSIKSYSYRFTDAARELQNLAAALWSGMSNENLQAIKIPCLILKARNDWVLRAETPLVFINNIPNSKLIIYPDGGHFCIHHKPHEIASDIVNFFIN